MSSEHYTKAFYQEMRDGARRSAEVMVPLALEVVPARSVVDVGCGDGTWLATFQKFGVSDILGIDGDYVEQDFLQIPPERFQPMDLAKPFHLGRTFDLAISLEVAEHLPPETASDFVRSLTGASPAVLFSAAIPHQGGQNHINEKWPDQWAALFRERGYLPIDAVRKRIWHNDEVEWWYAQNTLLFAQRKLVEYSPALKAALERTDSEQLSLVHPKQHLFLEKRYREAMVRADRPTPPSGVIAATRLLAVCLRNAVQKRVFGGP